ncbi:MamK family actin-like protein [Candidatus Hydrogenedentota bacterium]
MAKKAGTRSKSTGGKKTQDSKPSASKKAPTLLVGIDLGTSRTAISSSNGHRLMVSTYVGKPKDVISEKLFGKRLLFGDEALNNRLSVELFRPLEKGVVKTSAREKTENIEAAKELLAHIVSLVSPSNDDVIYGVIGVPARASIESKKILIDIVRDVFDAVMIVSEPFSVAYGLDTLTDALVLDIGAGTMDLCRLHGVLPGEEDQITIEKAGDFIDESLFNLIREKHPEAQFSINMIRNIKEKHGYVYDNMEQVKVEFPVKGKPTTFDITEELKSACKAIAPDLVEAIHTLIGGFDPEFQARLRDNVIVCGGGSQMVGLRTLIEESLDELGGGRVTIIDEPVYAGCNGALRIAREMPDSFWEHLRE